METLSGRPAVEEAGAATVSSEWSASSGPISHCATMWPWRRFIRAHHQRVTCKPKGRHSSWDIDFQNGCGQAALPLSLEHHVTTAPLSSDPIWRATGCLIRPAVCHPCL